MSSSASTRIGERVTVSMAVVKVKVGGESLISAAEGNGPVNALDLALRKDLGKYQSYIGGLELTDYRVRILNGGTEAVTRVLIESQDETGERWSTVGVSPNIIDASFQALMDSIVYKLVQAPARRGAATLASASDGGCDDRSRLYRRARSRPGAALLRSRAREPLGSRSCAKIAGTVGYGKTYPEFWINHRAGSAPRRTPACMSACARRAPRRSMPFMPRRCEPAATSDGAPGLRPEYSANYYAAFIRDPDGNRIEAVDVPDGAA